MNDMPLQLISISGDSSTGYGEQDLGHGGHWPDTLECKAQLHKNFLIEFFLYKKYS